MVKVKNAFATINITLVLINQFTIVNIYEFNLHICSVICKNGQKDLV